MNGYIVDINYDATYEVILLENKLPFTIDETLLGNIFGGKRAYYVSFEHNSLSLRFNSDFETYLNKLGFVKEEGRDGMLTTHRIEIPVSIVRNYQDLI